MISIPECTLCGRNVEKLFLAEVEECEIEVCEACGKFGNMIGEIKPQKIKPKRASREIEKESEDILKDNYGKIIMQSRQKIGLERKEFSLKINEKESIIRRVELQEMVPDEKLRKKIEEFLGIKLTEKYEILSSEQKKEKPSLTLGDIVEVK